MAKSDIDEKIRGMLEAFAGDLAGLIRESAMQSVRDALGGEAAGGRGRRGARALAAPLGRRLPKGAKRPPDEIVKLTSRLLEYVKGHKGERIEQIAKGMSVSTRELNLPVKKLIAGKSIKTRGQKRATQYFPR
ncbi:MAG TPA: hypothetical protein VMI54_14640 [Polyangiaceae bacterium]|nr:hypothetical protein [Polyangiaceae bacterium]